ncbi:septal ring lytic transglycosylase RlpA family protein [Acanthopleuribacter pedis]|uniref:Probable endolytic peptidoglycan transglycosylase RlpA n=1 Tax=Acanthopleuribacter pedis TaxID=442870 RepID=A0A8J7U165_9BACT|nr:septal ring lytic transglycosylase RlpA family protein [Acanthopleuribacter pedis]MBO1317838.1 septal ring lytic transglycosylase RlpA family protein [Acanthopleuribacter pedis]
MKQTMQRKWMGWLMCCLVLGAMLSCGGRKDVNRRGEIKLRGERPVSMRGKREGDLLQKGIASWYGRKYHGRKTSNGERYNMHDLTAAHKTIPFGTLVEVVNRDNGRRVLVRINDRGPFVRGRIIDLSKGAAKEIGLIGTGTAQVALYLANDDFKGWTKKRDRRQTKPIPVNQGFWSLQVGSFQERGRAMAMRERLAFHNLPVFISETDDGFQRVRIGQFTSRDDALRHVAQIEDSDIQPWVVFVEADH